VKLENGWVSIEIKFAVGGDFGRDLVISVYVQVSIKSTALQVPYIQKDVHFSALKLYSSVFTGQ